MATRLSFENMEYKRINKPPHLRDHTPSWGEAVPYMLQAAEGKQGCIFDQRHFVYDTLDGVYPFPVTTRIHASNQIWLLKKYGDTIKF